MKNAILIRTPRSEGAGWSYYRGEGAFTENVTVAQRYHSVRKATRAMLLLTAHFTAKHGFDEWNQQGYDEAHLVRREVTEEVI